MNQVNTITVFGYGEIGIIENNTNFTFIEIFELISNSKNISQINTYP